MTPRAPSPQRGFTLIEVMIAIAILAMALTAVFGSNIGAARSTAHSRMVTRATMMGRCRLTEVEAYLIRTQLPIADQTITDPPEGVQTEPCCTDGVTCDVKLQRIDLPSPSTIESAAGDQLLGRAAGAAQGTSFGGSAGVSGGDGGTPLGALAGAMGMLNGASGSSGSSGSGTTMSGAGAPSPREMASSLLTTVYPTIKPLLEGAIRKLTMTVSWHEGTRENSFEVVEYVVNPGQTLPPVEDPNGPRALQQGAPGSTTTGTPGAGLGAPGATPILGLPGLTR